MRLPTCGGRRRGAGVRFDALVFFSVEVEDDSARGRLLLELNRFDFGVDSRSFIQSDATACKQFIEFHH